MGINSLKKTEEHPTSTKVHYQERTGVFQVKQAEKRATGCRCCYEGCHAIEATCNVCLVYLEP